jgi:phage/plasmid-like protein (TIGR03299 family)
MKHEITQTDSSFVTRQPAWHGLGTVVQNAPTSANALRQAGLMWKVAQAPVQWMDETGTLQVDGAYKCNYREDNGNLLGIVGSGYTVVQNETAFAFTDYLADEGVVYETAGSVKGGKMIWLLAKMPEQKILQDAYVPYLLFVNGHDGRTAVNVCMTPVRVVCKNTINLALLKAKRRWTFSHTTNVMCRITNAQQTLVLSKQYMETLKENAEVLAAKRLTPDTVRSLTDVLFPALQGTVANEHNQERIARFQQCYEAPDLDNVRGTAYGFLMAVSDYTSHVNFGEGVKAQRKRERHFLQTVLQPASLLAVTNQLFAT